MKRYIVDVYKNRTFWKNEAGQFHREDGPAVEYANGDKLWYVNGERHRTDGPAVVRSNGDKEWWVEGKLYRTDGPAVEYVNGSKEWWVEGKLHRTDGPAIEFANGRKSWYIEGEPLSESNFNKRTKQTTCEGKVVEIDGVKYKLTKV